MLTKAASNYYNLKWLFFFIIIILIYLNVLAKLFFFFFFQVSGTREFIAEDEIEESDLSDFEVIYML